MVYRDYPILDTVVDTLTNFCPNFEYNTLFWAAR